MELLHLLCIDVKTLLHFMKFIPGGRGRRGRENSSCLLIGDKALELEVILKTLNIVRSCTCRRSPGRRIKGKLLIEKGVFWSILLLKLNFSSEAES